MNANLFSPIFAEIDRLEKEIVHWKEQAQLWKNEFNVMVNIRNGLYKELQERKEGKI